jgi:hypothetical protein
LFCSTMLSACRAASIATYVVRTHTDVVAPTSAGMAEK